MTQKSFPSLSVRIQPAVIFSIFDQFQRRSELCTGRLIGAIFGTRNEEDSNEGIISVSQAFPIPHSEINDQVIIFELIILIRFLISIFSVHPLFNRSISIANIIKIGLN